MRTKMGRIGFWFGILVAGVATAGDLTPLQLALWSPIQIAPPHWDVAGLRFDLFFGENRDVDGIDGGLVNKTTGKERGVQAGILWNGVGGEFVGIQMAGLVNNVKGSFTGIQFGLVNASAAVAKVTDDGVQLGFANLAGDLDGLQVGLYNQAKAVTGLQFGLMNQTDKLKGLQIGLICLAKDSPAPFTSLLNANW